jgi:septal ring factor EnvC (AmiA/AmiB activator)
MRAPEVVISSDSEVKIVKLNKIILKDTCAKTVSSIKAIDPSSIVMKAIDKTNLNKKIEKNEKEFEKLEIEIANVNDQIRIKSNLISWQFPDYELAKEINGLAMELSELRKQKDQLKFEYYELIYKIKGN